MLLRYERVAYPCGGSDELANPDTSPKPVIAIGRKPTVGRWTVVHIVLPFSLATVSASLSSFKRRNFLTNSLVAIAEQLADTPPCQLIFGGRN